MAAILLLAAPAGAQDEDRGVLEAFLEDNLSDAGREVQIVGFEGALSGRATLESLTIADEAGVWLTIEGAVFDWNRAALLGRRLEITELSANSIKVVRAPAASDGAPSPEASPFVLPDLPVSIQIGSFKVADVELGAPFLGQRASFSVDGAALLAGGAGSARLDVRRKDGPAGRIGFDGAFSNETQELSVLLALSEARGGLAAALLGLPGQPALDFKVAGSGPIDNYTADIALSTEGQPRLAGTVATTADEARARRVAVEIGGDLRPLVEPRYHAFLGDTQRLTASGTRAADGRLDLQALSLRSGVMDVRGSAAIAADGWPERIDITGRVTSALGPQVLLSLPGPETRVASADLSLFFDAASGDSWTFSAQLEDFQREEISLATAAITGQGSLSRDLEQVAGAIDMNLGGVSAANPDIARAIGPELQGAFGFDWRKGSALQVPSLTISGTGYGLTGTASVDGVEGQIDLAITSDLQFQVHDLGQFAGLAGQDLSGSTDLRVKAAYAPASGAFEVMLDGDGSDVAVGEPLIDPLIAGAAELSVSAKRDMTGLRLDHLKLSSEALRIGASGFASSVASDLAFDVTLTDAGRLMPGATGTALLAGSVTQDGPQWRLLADASGPGDANARIAAVTTRSRGAFGASSAEVQLKIGDLKPYAGLANRATAGAISLTLRASGDPRDDTFSADLKGEGDTIQIGIAEADLLLRGESTLKAVLRRGADAVTVIEGIALQTPQIGFDLDGSVGASLSRVDYAIDLNDLGLFVPGLNGPFTAQGALNASGGPWNVTSAISGPGGTAATVAGQVASDGETADLSISGSGPLALVNRFIVPNLAEGTARFDLRLNGAPGLNALSGTIGTNNARLVLPTLGLGLNTLTAEARLGDGAARVSARGALVDGGRVSLDGNLGLNAPFPADLEAVIDAAKVQRAGLYATTVDGRLGVLGALAGGASLNGSLALGTTELRVPDSAGPGAGALPGLKHLNEPLAVRQTRSNAGLIDTGDRGGGGVYPIDLAVSAPSRIFIRGRGLDAELGGALRLTGDSENVLTSGRFDLIRGRLDILGKRLALSEASVMLQGDFDPYIRAVANTESAGTRIQVVVEGLASAPSIAFTSSPDLPEDEILARLIFGRDLSQISPLQALQIANAVRVLAGEGGEGLVGKLRQSFGLDNLDIRTAQDGGAGLRAGKYINENIYTDVTVDTQGRSEVNLNLSVTPSITARGSLSSDGESSLGVFFERDY